MGAIRLSTLVLRSVVGATVAAACLVVAPPAGATPVVTSFSATGTIQEFTVPAGVCKVGISATGASGGTSTTVRGGHGAKVDAWVPVAPGSVLQVLVGSAGGSTTGPRGIAPGGAGGFGGGGGGGWWNGAGGGGASVVSDGSGPLVVAGAGGGGAGFMRDDQDGFGGDAGTLGHDAQDGVDPNGNGGATGGTATGDGGIGADIPGQAGIFPPSSAGSGGGVGHGGANLSGARGGDGDGAHGGGGAGVSTGDPVHSGDAAAPTETGAGGEGGVPSAFRVPGGRGGAGTAGGGDGGTAESGLLIGGGGGGGGGIGIGGGGGGVWGGGGGAGYGAGGGGAGGGGGGSSWVTPRAWYVGSRITPKLGDGRVTISVDSTASLCTTVVPGSGAVTAPTSGSADLAVAVTLSSASAVPVTVQWSTVFVPGAPGDTILGPQAATSDYTPSGGTVTFAPGVTTAVVHIPVTGAAASPVEYVVVSFTGATNAGIGGFYGLGFGIIHSAA